MRPNHLVPCVAMLGAAVLVAVVWGVQLGTLALVAVMLLCPALMLLVMRSMAADDRSSHSDHHTPAR